MIVLVAGSAAIDQETQTDSAVVKNVLDLLNRLYGPQLAGKRIPNPLNTHVTRWKSNPWARGSYSFQTMLSSPRDRDTLAGPVEGSCGRLLFAGEATSRTHPATAHGAWLSGCQSAAQALLYANIEVNGRQNNMSCADKQVPIEAQELRAAGKIVLRAIHALSSLQTTIEFAEKAAIRKPKNARRAKK